MILTYYFENQTSYDIFYVLEHCIGCFKELIILLSHPLILVAEARTLIC